MTQPPDPNIQQPSEAAPPPMPAQPTQAQPTQEYPGQTQPTQAQPEYPPPAGSAQPPGWQPPQQAGYPQAGEGYPQAGAGYPQAGAGYPQAGAGLVPTGMYRDQASGLALPDGTQLASVGRRIGAYFLSLLLFIVTLGIGYLVWGLVVWGRGQTPALQVLGMRCWRPESAQTASWGWMALREIVGRFVEGLIFVTLIVSFILMLAREDRKCLHDLIAGTVVLYDPNKVLAR